MVQLMIIISSVLLVGLVTIIWRHDVMVIRLMKSMNDERHRAITSRIDDLDRMSRVVSGIADQICIFAELSQTKVDLIRDEREYQHRELMKRVSDDPAVDPIRGSAEDLMAENIINKRNTDNDAIAMSSAFEGNGTLE